MTHSVEQGTTAQVRRLLEHQIYRNHDFSEGCTACADAKELAQALATQPTEARAERRVTTAQELATYVALRLPERIPLRGDRNEAREVISRLLTEAGAPTEARPLDEARLDEVRKLRQTFAATKEPSMIGAWMKAYSLIDERIAQLEAALLGRQR